jgi:hypothetical protein
MTQKALQVATDRNPSHAHSRQFCRPLLQLLLELLQVLTEALRRVLLALCRTSDFRDYADHL